MYSEIWSYYHNHCLTLSRFECYHWLCCWHQPAPPANIYGRNRTTDHRTTRFKRISTGCGDHYECCVPPGDTTRFKSARPQTVCNDVNTSRRIKRLNYVKVGNGTPPNPVPDLRFNRNNGIFYHSRDSGFLQCTLEEARRGIKCRHRRYQTAFLSYLRTRLQQHIWPETAAI